MPRRPASDRDAKRGPSGDREVLGLRIIGGTFRGRKLEYSGDTRTRPMKGRVREAVFNLIGPSVVGAHAIDLFAGTGAIGIEALSRGAAQATFIEQHFPTADLIRRNACGLGVDDERFEIVPGNTFLWWRRRPELGTRPWLVIASPPFEFYVSRQQEMLDLLGTMIAAAPAESVFVVEADERFDMGLLPRASDWDVRVYAPAVIGILRVTNE